MDTRLLDYYNRELGYFREMGAEFAQEYPKVAGRLGLRGTETPDPYVERLLEGVSFLTARIQLKMDAEFPRFSQRLLDLVCPHYLAPTPAMGIVKFEPSFREGNLLNGYTIPARTPLRAHLAKSQQTACEFRTAHEVCMWPLALAASAMEGDATGLSLNQYPLPGPVRSVLRLRLEIIGATALRVLPISELNCYLGGQEHHAMALLEQLLRHAVGMVGHVPGAKRGHWLAATHLQQMGMDSEQALLPNDVRAFQGYRLLHEYFAFPTRFLFFKLGGLRELIAAIDGPVVEIDILFDSPMAELEHRIDRHSVQLNCTPVINLFEKHSDRLPISAQRFEQHVVMDRTRPMDHEVYAIKKVVGYRREASTETRFRPFYATVNGDPDNGAYFSSRREPRRVPEHQSRDGRRTGYLGSEVYLSLVDQRDAPYPDDLSTLAVTALCTNRDLSLLLPTHEASDFSMRISAPVASIKLLRGPSRPREAIAEGETTWRLISHLNLNYLSLTDLDGDTGAQTLRELLQLYAGVSEPGLIEQINGIRSVKVEPVYQQIPDPGPLVFGRGVRIAMIFDAAAFSGAGIYLFGSVLEHFLARHVSINSFIELHLTCLQTGEVTRWPTRMGRRPSL